MRLGIVLLGLGLASGCGGAGGTTDAGADAEPDAGPSSVTLVVTADFLNQSITLFDLAKLIDGSSDAEAARVDTIDLSDYAPGPLELELTPDGSTAVVAIAPGFFGGALGALIGASDVPAGGTLLIVDLESHDVSEVTTSDVPMGIAISADGMRAYTANYGAPGGSGTTVSVIDIPNRQVLEEVTVGSGPEQIALSPDGTLGVVNLAGQDGVRLFDPSDVENTLSELFVTGNDPSGVTFIGGDDRLLVGNSMENTFTLIDTSTPNTPAVLDEVESTIPYNVLYLPGRDLVLAALGLSGALVTMTVEDDELVLGDPLPTGGGAFPLNTAANAEETHAFVPHPANRTLSIVDIEAGTSRTISWLSESGPTHVAVQR